MNQLGGGAKADEWRALHSHLGQLILLGSDSLANRAQEAAVSLREDIEGVPGALQNARSVLDDLIFHVRGDTRLAQDD